MDQLRDLAADLRIEPSALLDIFLTAVLIYVVLRLIQGTRAVRLAIGAAIVYGVYVFALELDLRLLSGILQTGAVVGLVALVVVYLRGGADFLNMVVPHQANLRINEAFRERMNIPEEKIYNNIQRYGNTTAATIPIALDEAVREGRVKSGDVVLMAAFGAGLTWAGSVVRW